MQSFDEQAFLALIQQFVRIESRWIPSIPDHSLYIRPTFIGTRSSKAVFIQKISTDMITAIGVGASDSACLYVILTPAGPYFREESKGISVLAVSDIVRTWPGGTGSYKFGTNYSPGFLPLQLAAKKGYDQILWLLGDNDSVTEAGPMNVFVVVQRDDGGIYIRLRVHL